MVSTYKILEQFDSYFISLKYHKSEVCIVSNFFKDDPFLLREVEYRK